MRWTHLCHSSLGKRYYEDMTKRTWSRITGSRIDIYGNTHQPSGKKKRSIFAPELIMKLFLGEKENHLEGSWMRKRPERRHIKRMKKKW
jgi:hypothetical protein